MAQPKKMVNGFYMIAETTSTPFSINCIIILILEEFFLSKYVSYLDHTHV
jgi:hypothetical protein